MEFNNRTAPSPEGEGGAIQGLKKHCFEGAKHVKNDPLKTTVTINFDFWVE